MSKHGPLINGETSSINDAMLSNVEGRAMRSRDYLRDDWNDKIGKMFSCDVDHMYASVNDVQAKDREISKLKEINLVHLDLIQRQADIILSRDKELAMVKADYDNLRLRFERMERRVTLQKLKDEPPPPNYSILPSTIETPTVPTLLVTSVDTSSYTPPEPPIKRRRTSTLSMSRRKRRTISTGSDRTKLSFSASDSNEVENRVRSRLQLTTDAVYYTVVGDVSDVWGPLDLRVPTDGDLSQREEQVQVPSWREKILSPLYVIEGTENLEDEVFLKRHLKLESDERRRKRWDIQRIREQTHVEKLKQRVMKGRSSCSSQPTENEITSFFPAQDDVQEIVVDPNLPVVAFGLPLRVFDPCEFSLSWNATPAQKYLNLRQR